MQNRNITDIFFDLDHTLWDFDKNSALAYGRVFQKHQITLNLHDFMKVYEPINAEYWRKYSLDTISKDELRRGRLLETFESLKIPVSEMDIKQFSATYISELAFDNHLLDGSLELLEYLFPKYKLHIITNGFTEVQHLKIENSGIQKYFRTVTTSEEAGAKKPHPTIFGHAIAKAQAQPQHSLMIGDNLEADIIGARNAGMDALHFDCKGENISTSSLAIHSLRDIKKCL